MALDFPPRWPKLQKDAIERAENIIRSVGLPRSPLELFRPTHPYFRQKLCWKPRPDRCQGPDAPSATRFLSPVAERVEPEFPFTYLIGMGKITPNTYCTKVDIVLGCGNKTVS